MSRLLRFLQRCATVLAASGALLFPASEAGAATADEIVAAVKLVCGNVPDVCGPYDDVVLVADACLKGGDELACALSVVNASGNKGPQQALDRYYLVMACINGASPEQPVTPECDQKLAEAGMPEPQRSEAKALVTMCVQSQDVDAVIVCADALLDSSFADDAGIDPPSWVDSLFDIYMDIRTPDYVSLIYHVGASVACLVANILGGIDVCGLIETLAAIGGAIADGLDAAAEFLSDFFGGGGCTFKVDDQCVQLHQMLAKLLEPKLPASLEARKKGPADWAARRAQAFAEIKQHPLWSTGYPATPADEEAAWKIHQAQVYPQWDAAMPAVIEARRSKIEGQLTALDPQAIVKVLQDESDFGGAEKIKAPRFKCMAASKDETDKLIAWTQEGRAGKGQGVAKAEATCGYRIARAMLEGLKACTLQLNEPIESLRATCDTGSAMDVCKAAQMAFGHERVEACGFGKGGEKGVAQATLKTWTPAPIAARCAYDEAAFPNAFKCNDPAAAKECATRIGARYGNLDWPKPGIAECKVVETAKRIKAVADAAKVAQAIPGVVLPGSKMNNLGCKPDGYDAAIVSCVQLALDAAQVAKVKAAAGVPVRQCTAAESTTKPTHAWLEEACIAQEPLKNLQVTKDLAKPAAPGVTGIDKAGKAGGLGGYGLAGGGAAGAGIAAGGVAGPAPGIAPGKAGPGGGSTAPGTAKPGSVVGGKAVDRKLPDQPPGVGSSLNIPGK